MMLVPRSCIVTRPIIQSLQAMYSFRSYSRPMSSCYRSARPIVLLLVALLMLAGIDSARAQEVRRISFNDAVRLGLEQNIALKRATNTAELQEIAVSRARMDFFPDLSVSTSGSQNYGRNFIMDEGRIVSTTIENVNFNVGSRVNLFDGFGNVSTLRRARHQQEASELDLDRAQQTVVFNVMDQFVTLVERREQIRVQEENLTYQQEQLQRIQAFTEVGSRPVSDLYQQQAEVASAEVQVLNAQRAYQLAEAQLIQTLQLDPFGTYEFVAPAAEELVLAPRQYNPRTMLENAFEQRADLRAAETSIIAAQEGIRVARSTMWPSLGLSAGYGSSYSSAGEFGLLDQFDQRRGGSIGLSLSIPVFDKRLTHNSVQQARVTYDNARLDLQELQQGIAVQVRQAYLDYELAEKTLEATGTQERAAEQALQAAQERYNLQAATLIEVTQARANYVQAVSNRLQARYDLVFQQKLIDYYLGTLDPAIPLFE